MQRVAVVAPRGALRAVLVRVADAGCVELDRPDVSPHGTGPAARALQTLRTEAVPPILSRTPPDLRALQAAGRADLLAGEAQLEAHRAAAVGRFVCPRPAPMKTR